MAYVADEARQELLDTVAEAADALGEALAALGAAYEQLDDQSAERIEELLFRPAQAAYGLAQRTHAGFAGRHGLPEREFSAGVAGHSSRGARAEIDSAVDAAENAEAILVELQDSMAPVEVGDTELRAGLAEIRASLADFRVHAEDFVRRLGR